MRRFVAGLVTGCIAGAVAWYFSHGDAGLTVFVGVMVALITWFTRAADEILDWGLDFAGTIVRGIDKIL